MAVQVRLKGMSTENILVAWGSISQLLRSILVSVI